MTMSAGALRTLGTVVLALALSLVLDVAFDLPVLARWAVVLAVLLVVHAAIEAVRRRGHRPSDRSRRA